MLKLVPYSNYAELFSLKGQTGIGVAIRVLDAGKQINIGTNKVELDAGVDSAGNLGVGLPIKDTDGIQVFAPIADVVYARAQGSGVNQGVKVEVMVYRRTP